MQLNSSVAAVVTGGASGLGYTDDAAVFAALLAVLGRNLKPKHKAAARRDIERLRGED